MPAGGGQPNPLDLREIFRTLRRRVQVVAAVPIALVVLALLFVAIVTPLYTGIATVLIDPRRASVLDSGSTQTPASNYATDDASIESQVSLIESIAVLQRVIENLKLTQDPEFAPPPGILDSVKRLFSWGSGSKINAEDLAKARALESLQRKLKVVRQRSTFLVDINLSSREASKAAAIANAIADEFFMEQLRSKDEARKVAARWLSRQLGELKLRVATSDKAVEDFRAANNLIASQGVTINDQQLTDVNNKLIEASVQTAEARAKFDQVQEIAKTKGDPGAVTEALSSDIISRLRGQYADLAKSVAELSTRYGARHPMVASAAAQLRDTQRLINEEVQRVLESRRHAYDVATAREASLRKSLDALQGVSSESGQAQVRLRELQREADSNRTLYESFLNRFKETSAQESLELPDSRIVTRADVPVRPSFPKTLLVVGLALALGIAMGCAAALLIDYLDRRVKTFEQAEAASGFTAIAAIPLIGLRELASLAKRGRRELHLYDPRTMRLLPPSLQPPIMRYAIDDPTSIFAEGVRAVRLAIQRACRVEPTQIVVVTSSIDGEGKTTLAANLALSLATIGVRTILVEGDLRNPELTRSFCPRAQVGLIDVAMGRAPLHQAILVEQATGLSVLPSPRPNNVAALTEFVFSEGLGTIFDVLRNHYDVIVVDSPPLMPLVDGRALAEHADRVVMAIGWDRTPRDVLARAVDLLAPVHNRILGTVMTRVDLRRLRFYDYYRSSAYVRPYRYGADMPQQEAAE